MAVRLIRGKYACLAQEAEDIRASRFTERCAEALAEFSMDVYGVGDDVYSKLRDSSAAGRLIEALDAIGDPLGAPDLGSNRSG